MGFLSKLACWRTKASVPMLIKAVTKGTCNPKLVQQTRHLEDVDEKGRTALHVAALLGKRNFITMILSEADRRLIRNELVAMVDHDGKTALDLALNWPDLYTVFYPEDAESPVLSLVEVEDSSCEARVVTTDKHRFKDTEQKQELKDIVSLQTMEARLIKVMPRLVLIPPKPVDGLTGLLNLGNTCYMNAVLQVLANIYELLTYFKYDTYIRDIVDGNPFGSSGKVVKAFSSVIKGLWKSKKKIIKPLALKNIIADRCSTFRGWDQQDAQEFCAFLLDNIHEDLNHGQIPGKPSITGDTNNGENFPILKKKASKAWSLHITRNNSIIVNLFHLQLESKVTCLACHKSSKSFDPCGQISLPIPRSSNMEGCSLQDCFNIFMEVEILDELRWCQHCSSFQKASKKMSISCPPSILVLHLKRFTFDEYGQKITRAVTYPIDNFDLAPYMSHSTLQNIDNAILYDLCGVICHSGSLSMGHYTGMARLINKNDEEVVGWRNFDDSLVTTISSETVVSENAYVLIYRRKERNLIANPEVQIVTAFDPVMLIPHTSVMPSDSHYKNCEEKSYQEEDQRSTSIHDLISEDHVEPKIAFQPADPSPIVIERYVEGTMKNDVIDSSITGTAPEQISVRHLPINATIEESSESILLFVCTFILMVLLYIRVW